MNTKLPIALIICMSCVGILSAQKTKTDKEKKPAGAASSGIVLKTHADSVAYAMGVSMYMNTAQTGIESFDFDVFVKGMEAQKNGAPLIDPAASDNIIRSEMKRVQEEKGQKNKKEGEAFLAENKNKPGVKSTPSGLQYKVVTEGTGAKPDANDKVTVHYHGTLIDGTVFDSSVNRGSTISFGLNQVIPGWTEGLQLMSEGSKYILYIPQNLAYGARAQGKILPYSALVFEVELFSIEKVN